MSHRCRPAGAGTPTSRRRPGQIAVDLPALGHVHCAATEAEERIHPLIFVVEAPSLGADEAHERLAFTAVTTASRDASGVAKGSTQPGAMMTPVPAVC